MEEFPDALLTLDGDGRIRSWLGTAPELFGLTVKEAAGRPVASLLADARDSEVFDPAAIAAAGRRDAALRARTAQGIRELAWTLSPLPAGLAVVACPLEPELTPAGGHPERWRELLGGALRRLLESGVEAEAELAPLVVAEGNRLLPGFDCVLSVRPPERRHDIGEAGEVTSAYLVPLVARSLPGRRRLGVLGFYTRERRFCTPYERRLMLELAGLVSLALQRAELRRLLEDANLRLELGVGLALDLATSLDPRDVVRHLLERTLSACAADRVTLLRLEGDEVIVEDGLDVDGRAAEPGVRAPAASLVSRSGRRRLLLEALGGSRPVASRGYRMPGFSAEVRAAVATLRHTLFLPLVVAGEADSVLIVGRRGERAFGTGDHATLRLIGNVAVLALRNARLYSRAREDGRVKSDFLNLAAHELRTPLTVVLGYLSMLEDGSFGPAADGWESPLRLLSAKVRELARLVDALLLAGRLETGRVSSSASAFDLRGAAEGAVARARPSAEAMGGRIELVLPARRVEVVVDPEHVATILDSLLENGLKYSDGPPAVRLVVDAASGPRRVAVEDAGRGIAPDHRERIFDRFYRGEEAGAGPPGTGLGLHISRELAAALGGRLWLDWSEPGLGSRFVLELPAPRRGE